MSLRYDAPADTFLRKFRFQKFCFSPKASGFYPFGDAAALTEEGGVRVVVWLIQASA